MRINHRLLFPLLVALLTAAAVPVRAEKAEMYTSSDEFLPLGAELGGEWASIDRSYLEDENSLRNGRVQSIAFLRDESSLLFTIGTDDPKGLAGKKLYYSVDFVDFPPRMILVLHGVRSEENVFRFFTEGFIRGIVLNPFYREDISEYVFFFDDDVSLSTAYDQVTGKLTVSFSPATPRYRRGFGVRIADTRIDPLPQIIEIKKELSAAGLDNYLLVGSDHETIVLESPFYETREEAITFMESLESFGYNGKLAIRGYRDYPKPNRVDVVSEVVISGTDDPNLINVVNTKLNPTKLYTLSTERIFALVLPLFSSSVREDEGALSEHLYALSEVYLNYPAEDQEGKNRSYTVALKLLEIIYFRYPDAERADDALWDMANLIRRFEIQNRLTEEECYRRIVREYPKSLFYKESVERLKAF
jgi:hypothetical protein